MQILNNWSTLSLLEKPKVLIAAHRGKFGAHIPENTLESCEFALSLGADILEVDICRTKDGALVLLHGPKVDRVTTGHGFVSELTFEEVKQLKFMSAIGQVTNKSINTLDELLENFYGRCLINLDRCWNHFDDVFDAVIRHGMTNQIVFKSPKPMEESLKWLESRDFQPHYIPIVKDYCELIKWSTNAYKASIPAIELVFDSEDSLLITTETIKMFHDQNIRVWLNALTLKEVLAAGHDDTISVLGNPGDGWGWLVERGADIIQTDWVMEMGQYLKKAGYR